MSCFRHVQESETIINDFKISISQNKEKRENVWHILYGLLIIIWLVYITFIYNSQITLSVIDEELSILNTVLTLNLNIVLFIITC